MDDLEFVLHLEYFRNKRFDLEKSRQLNLPIACVEIVVALVCHVDYVELLKRVRHSSANVLQTSVRLTWLELILHVRFYSINNEKHQPVESCVPNLMR